MPGIRVTPASEGWIEIESGRARRVIDLSVPAVRPAPLYPVFAAVRKNGLPERVKSNETEGAKSC